MATSDDVDDDEKYEVNDDVYEDVNDVADGDFDGDVHETSGGDMWWCRDVCEISLFRQDKT